MLTLLESGSLDGNAFGHGTLPQTDNQRWDLYFTSFKIQYKTNLYISLLTGFVYTIIIHSTSLYTAFHYIQNKFTKVYYGVPSQCQLMLFKNFPQHL